MTQAQTDAYVCGIAPQDHDPRFAAQHMAAYVFARPLVRGKRVLEVGFGEGYGADYLAQEAAEVIGIDMAPGNIPRASGKYPRPNLSFQQMDATRLEFQDGAFDAVCSFQVIEHIPEPQIIPSLAEIARVLKSDELCSNVVDGAKRTGVSLVEESKPWRVGDTPQPGGYAHAAGYVITGGPSRSKSATVAVG